MVVFTECQRLLAFVQKEMWLGGKMYCNGKLRTIPQWDLDGSLIPCCSVFTYYWFILTAESSLSRNVLRLWPKKMGVLSAYHVLNALCIFSHKILKASLSSKHDYSSLQRRKQLEKLGSTSKSSSWAWEEPRPIIRSLDLEAHAHHRQGMEGPSDYQVLGLSDTGQDGW
jgi:hypothetical protein